MELAASPTEQSFRFEIITDPPSLPAERHRELIDAFVELSARTTGGADWRSYRPALDGWREYYNAPGARPQDFERLVLAYDGDMLIHFTAVVRYELTPCEPLIFIRSGFTHNDYHGTGLLKTAVFTIFSPAWLQELAASSPKVTIAIRTANPVVYEAARNLVERIGSQSPVAFSMVPEILPGGKIAPVPDEVKELAQRTVAVVSPDSVFLPDTFVNKAYYKRYGALYKEAAFPCRNPATQEFFTRWIDYSNQDGILILVQMRRESR
jgi:hypothetical protein